MVRLKASRFLTELTTVIAKPFLSFGEQVSDPVGTLPPNGLILIEQPRAFCSPSWLARTICSLPRFSL